MTAETITKQRNICYVRILFLILNALWLKLSAKTRFDWYISQNAF